MISLLKVVIVALAVTGAAGSGVTASVVKIPLENAVQVHEDHMGEDSSLPDQATKGQQTALDHLRANQERWLANHPNMTLEDRE